MKKRWMTFSTIALVSILMSCGGGETSKEDWAGYSTNSMDMSDDYAPTGNYEEGYLEEQSTSSEKDLSSTPQEYVEIERKLIKTGYLEFEVEEFGETKRRINSAVEKHGAYISQEHEYGGYQRINTSVEIRVPAENFEALLADVTIGVEEFDARDIEVSDVTEEYIDIAARVKTKKEIENQYHELLKKATTIGDILDIQAEIGYLRAEIESLEGRLNYLSKSAAYSTLTILYYRSVPENNKFDNEFVDGFESGWENLIWFFVGLTHIWPVIALLLIAVIGYKLRKRMKSK